MEEGAEYDLSRSDYCDFLIENASNLRERMTKLIIEESGEI
jgi:hypothetical protein